MMASPMKPPSELRSVRSRSVTGAIRCALQARAWLLNKLTARNGAGDQSNPFLQQGSGPAGNANPFDDSQQSFAFSSLDTGANFGSIDPNFGQDSTSFIPLNDEVVPAVMVHPSYGTASSTTAAAPGAWGAPASSQRGWPERDDLVPAVLPASDMPFTASDLAFTETTAVPVGVSGRIGAENKGASSGTGGGGPMRDDGSRPLLASAEDTTQYGFWNLRRYRPYFNVDTQEVMWRVGNSLVGALRPNFMEVTNEAPDLYGPFWVATTLVFVTAVAGNFSSYLAWLHNSKLASVDDPTATVWYADATKYTRSPRLKALFIAMLVDDGGTPTGYSLSIFVPVSLLCILPVNWLRWLLVMVSTVMSGGFLMMNFRKTFTEVAAAQ
eukprot:gene27110-2335_t